MACVGFTITIIALSFVRLETYIQCDNSPCLLAQKLITSYTILHGYPGKFQSNVGFNPSINFTPMLGKLEPLRSKFNGSNLEIIR